MVGDNTVRLRGRTTESICKKRIGVKIVSENPGGEALCALVCCGGKGLR
jgi:hypothetical protein